MTSTWFPRRLVTWTILLAAAVGLDPAGARANPLLPGMVQDMTFLDVVMPDHTHARLEAMITRPDRPGRFPLAMLIHGTSRVPAERVALSPLSLLEPSIAFASHGYAAVAVLRHGFGQSEQPYRESSGCAGVDHRHVGDISADDVLAATTAAQAAPWADPSRVVLVGQSTGGFAVTAASARNPPGVRAIVDFAGGRGSRAENDVCNPDGLVAAAQSWGQTARIPALWMWTENDRYFAPTLGRRMFDAYAGAGAPAQFRLNPAYGEDGHTLFSRAPELWWDPVAAFLAAQGLPTAVVVSLPPPPPMPAIAGLNAACQTELQRYARLRTPLKAYAMSLAGGHCRWDEGRSQDEAAATARAGCEARWAACRVVARGQSSAD